MEFGVRDVVLLFGWLVTLGTVVAHVSGRIAKIEAWKEATEKRLDLVEKSSVDTREQLAELTGAIREMTRRIDDVLEQVRSH